MAQHREEEGPSARAAATGASAARVRRALHRVAPPRHSRGRGKPYCRPGRAPPSALHIRMPRPPGRPTARAQSAEGNPGRGADGTRRKTRLAAWRAAGTGGDCGQGPQTCWVEDGGSSGGERDNGHRPAGWRMGWVRQLGERRRKGGERWVRVMVVRPPTAAARPTPPVPILLSGEVGVLRERRRRAPVWETPEDAPHTGRPARAPLSASLSSADMAEGEGAVWGWGAAHLLLTFALFAMDVYCLVSYNQRQGPHGGS